MKISIYSRKSIEKLLEKRFPGKCSGNQFLWSARKIPWCGIQAGRLFGENELCISGSTAWHWSGSIAEISFDLRDIFSRSRWSCRIYFQCKKEGKDIICQCEYGESRSSGCAAAIHEYFYKDGIKIFADYRYYTNQMVYHKVYDALERYGIENDVIRESGE